MVEPDRSQMSIQYGVRAFVIWIIKAKDTNIRIHNSYCFPAEKIVTPSRFSVTFIRTLPVFF